MSDTLKKQIFEFVKKGEVDEVVRLVRETGIDIANLLEDAKNFNQTPVFFAAINPNHETALKMVQVLVEMGVNPLKEDLLKQNPLFYCAREGNMKVAQLLVQKGADVNHKDKYGQSAVYYSIREGLIQMTQFLIDSGANFDMPDSQQKRPIYYAI